MKPSLLNATKDNEKLQQRSTLSFGVPVRHERSSRGEVSLCLFMLFAFSFLLCGCPYNSDVPLDKPIVKIDPRLLGKWVEPGNKDEFYRVSRKNDFTYRIEIKNSKKEDIDTCFGYLTIINGTTFLNFWDKPEDVPQRYSFFKIEMKGDRKLIIATVTDNIEEQFKTSTALNKFFAGNMKNSYFFEHEKTALTRQEQ